MNIMLTILSLSISGSILILILMLCKPLCRRKLSRQWQYYIWLVVIARLLLPFAPEKNLVGALFQQTEQVTVHSVPLPPAEQQTVSDAFDVLPEEKNPESDGHWDLSVLFPEVFWIVWLGAALVLLIRKITLYQSFVQYIRAGWQEVSDVLLLDKAAQISAQMNVKQPVELAVNPLVSSPLLLGFFKPCIVLPSADLPDADFSCIIRHELTHFKRRDAFYKWLTQLTICLHWFNPLVWMMGREINRACELSCDEAVLASLEPQEYKSYGDTLLHAAATGGNCRNSLLSLTLHENGTGLKERLDAIMIFQKKSKWVAFVSLLLTGVLVTGAAAVGAYTGPKNSAASPETKVRQDFDASFFYTQDCYYQKPYLFEIAWNLQEEEREDYPKRIVTIWDQEHNENVTLMLYFSPECKQIYEDLTMMRTLYTQISELYFDTRDTQSPARQFLLVDARYVGDTNPKNLAEEYYGNDELPQFGAMFALLGETAQREWLDKIYEDDDAAFFSISLNQLSQDSPLFGEFAQKAYRDRNLAFFTILAGHLSKEELKPWLDAAIEDERTNFRAFLLEATGQEEELESWKWEMEEELLQEYQEHGITRDSKNYYFQKQLVHVFLDVRQDSSFQTLNINPKGTVSIKIVRDVDGEIQSVNEMAQQEVSALLDDMGGES